MAFGFSCFGDKPAHDAQSEVRGKILFTGSMAADKQHRHIETQHSGQRAQVFKHQLEALKNVNPRGQNKNC
jgi:hypothetical protein